MIIATLTTIYDRLEQGHTQQAILSILHQTTPPDHIYLFYSPDPALLDAGISPDDIATYLPPDIINSPLFTAIPVTPNTGPYRKLTPLFTPTPPAPTDIIITFDDDHVYAPDTIAKFMTAYKTHRCCVCSAAKRANLKGARFPLSGITLPYVDPADAPTLHLIPEGFGAVLYDGAMLSGIKSFTDGPEQHQPTPLTTNDDIWFRLFTFARGVRVIVVNTDKQAIISSNVAPKTLYNTYNSQGTSADTDHVIAAALADPFMRAHMAQWPTDEYIDMEDEVYTAKELTNIRHAFKAGTDVKLLQYERNAPAGGTAHTPQIDFLDLVGRSVGGGGISAMLINIEKDQRRYASAVGELKKLAIPTFTHLKATWWRNRAQFTQDINTVAAFLRVMGAPNVPPAEVPITFDTFSAASDPTIHIQDGPLACYCSHLRAMIGGFIQGTEAILICEDDMMIADPGAMSQAMRTIPHDWDVITFNSVPIGPTADTYTVSAETPWHRLTGPFYSTHFYLIRRKAMAAIFRAMWPVTDQVDILLSRLHTVLAMYNVPATVYQKNYSTNTQNNLWVILTSAGYEPIRARMADLTTAYCTKLGRETGLGAESPHIRRLVDNMIIDVLHQYIASATLTDADIATTTTIAPLDVPAEIYEPLHTIINCCVKGVGVHKACLAVIADIEAIITPIIEGARDKTVSPLGWGATATVFIDWEDDTIYKIYHKDVRWRNAPAQHKDVGDIFEREVAALERLGLGRINIWHRAAPLPVIVMPNQGMSLYEDFRLPENWREQLAAEFAEFASNGIAYTEFNLKNICVQREAPFKGDPNRITLIDFGLCRFESPEVAAITNAAACAVFTDLIGQIEMKFTTVHDPFLRKVIYNTFMQNMREQGDAKYMGYIY